MTSYERTRQAWQIYLDDTSPIVEMLVHEGLTKGEALVVYNTSWVANEVNSLAEAILVLAQRVKELRDGPDFTEGEEWKRD